MSKIIPVVLSGGSGTRLWPLSREKYPKQLLPLVGEHPCCRLPWRVWMALQNWLNRCWFVMTSIGFVVAEQLRLLGKQCKVILEPFGRNTAPALALAALWAAQQQGW